MCLDYAMTTVNWAHDVLLKYISSLPQMLLHLHYLSARDFRLPPLCILGVRSSRMLHRITYQKREDLNPLKPELNPICYLLALLGVHHFLHVSRIRVKSLTLR